MAFLRINGVDLHAEVAGSGDPVLFLHGGWCSLEHLRAQSDDLVRDHRVYAFERPGHGQSPDIDEEYSYSRGVADALAYLDAAGLGSVHVVGFSDGAIIGLLLALDHPARVRSLVAISANLDPSGFDLGAETDAEPADPVLAKLVRLWLSEPHIDPAELARITAPVLVMAADRDTVRPDHTLLIARSIPGAQLAIVPGATHGLVSERPDLVTWLIRDFLQVLERRSSQTK